MALLDTVIYPYKTCYITISTSAMFIMYSLLIITEYYSTIQICLDYIKISSITYNNI